MKKVYAVIQCFLSRRPNRHQATDRITPFVSHLSTKGHNSPPDNQRHATLITRNQCKPSNPRHGPKTGGAAHSGKSLAQPFLLFFCCSRVNRESQPRLL